MPRFNSILELPAPLRKQAAAKLATMPPKDVISKIGLGGTENRSERLKTQNTAISEGKSGRLDARKVQFEQQCALVGIELEREVKFHPTRRWRIDYVIAGTNLAVEYEGGIRESDRQKSGHLSYTGYLKDIQKYNALTVQGYRLIRIYAEAVKTGQALAWVEQAMKGRTDEPHN